jgi:hypothetical protein
MCLDRRDDRHEDCAAPPMRMTCCAVIGTDHHSTRIEGRPASAHGPMSPPRGFDAYGRTQRRIALTVEARFIEGTKTYEGHEKNFFDGMFGTT